MSFWPRLLPLAALLVPALPTADGPFTMAQVLGYPYPSELVTAPSGAAAAWVLNEHGARNIWVAEAPDWKARRLTNTAQDDGQELGQLQFTKDGKAVIYVRGGDHDANWDAPPPDPDHSPVEPKVRIWTVPVAGGAPKLLVEGDGPVVSPRGDVVAFLKGGQIWSIPVDGSKPASQLVFSRGENGSLAWSPDGSKLAFVTDRGDHSFIAVFTDDSTPLQYLAPSTSQDMEPAWSPDGNQIAFVRLPGAGGPPRSMLVRGLSPWAIWAADVGTGAGHLVWKAPLTLHASYGGAGLMWADGGRLVFRNGTDGWGHLYSVPVAGGDALLLTPGAFMIEQQALSPDRKTVVYSANTGADSDDIDRRHVFKVPVDRAAPVALTSGAGVEWTPAVTGDGNWVTLVSAEAKRPPVPGAVKMDGGALKLIGADRIPADFPTQALVVPRKVVFKAPDGTVVHGQLFEQPAITGKHPGIVFVHGGPPRQMLLGWHYMGYYSNAYAVNQYLASRGFVVLSVNYRLGIGYGWDFHHPPHAGSAGASEYQDVLAGGKWLAARGEVDPAKVGIWGGSYGGYLTALGLARNSDLFAAGVDFHGVHDWTSDDAERYTPRWRYERRDLDSARA
ncbi:MAG TPA: prolyl oligopeptidase family serine peptidase, partial [Gemmatimonadales bacterium]|nr:prolyl oligopeptidase family serine peptidase [Gemmatimonadales bacterium]